MQLESALAHGHYIAECRDKDGKIKWTDVIENVVATVGKNLALDTILAGTAYTAAVFQGLVSGTSYAPTATTITTGTYTSGTGAVSLTTAGAHGISVGDTFTIAAAAGTGANVSSLNGSFVATAGTATTTLNFTIATGLTITTITGGNVSYGVKLSDSMTSHTGWLECGNANAPAYGTTRKTAAFSAASGGSKALSAGLVYTFTSGGPVQGAFMTYGTGALTAIDNTGGILLSAGAFSGGPKTVANADSLTVSWSMSL